MPQASADTRLVPLPDLARMLGVDAGELRRLVRAGVLPPCGNDGETPLFAATDYGKARLLLDLLDAGLTPAQVKEMSDGAREAASAARAAARLGGQIDELLPRLTERLERLKKLREDLIKAREALHRCRCCHKPFEDLPCRTCRAMPPNLPRTLDVIFLATSPRR